MSKCNNLFLLFTLFLFTGLSFNSYAGPVCGDGNVDPDPPYNEECDEGDIAATNTCTNTTDQGNGTCTKTYCGDNIVQPTNGFGFNEQCEPPNTATCDDICQDVTTTTTTTAPTTTTTAAGTTTTTAAPTTTTTAAGTTTTTAAPTTTTTAAGTTTTTAAPTTTTTAAGTTTTTAAPTTTTTTMGGGGTTTTTTATTSTTAAATTTTTQVPGEPSVDVPLDGSDGTVTITTETGETISTVSTGTATGGPSGINFPFGTISYTTSSPVGGSVTMTFEFSTDLPDNLVIYKVDNGVYTELPKTIWTKVNARTINVTVTDGDPATDQDGLVNGTIEDPLAVGGGQGDTFDFGGGGCSISKTPSAGMDPIWLLLLLAPGLGILRRRVSVASGAKSV
jgi:hypothetical protein